MVLTKISSNLEIQEALENVQHLSHLSEKKLVSNKNNCTDLEIHEAFENIQNFRHLSKKQNPVTAFFQCVQKSPENLK
jgi:hypothetical protein